jgi:hypothetical protein
MDERQCSGDDDRITSALFGSSLHVPGGVECEVGNETNSREENDRNNNGHDYSPSSFAMEDSMRSCSE